MSIEVYVLQYVIVLLCDFDCFTNLIVFYDHNCFHSVIACGIQYVNKHYYRKPMLETVFIKKKLYERAGPGGG